jgi:hypothetical protein
MIRRLTFLAIALSTLSAVVGFVLSRAFAGALIALLIGSLWVVLELFRKPWIASPSMGLMIIVAMVGASQEYYAIFHALTVVAALSAWDLSRFGRRLILVEDDPSWTGATRAHVRRLLLVNGAGLLMAFLGISVQLGATFFVAWFLAVGVVVALFILVMRISKMTQ